MARNAAELDALRLRRHDSGLSDCPPDIQIHWYMNSRGLEGRTTVDAESLFLPHVAPRGRGHGGSKRKARR